ncbi:MAG TPA: hypothetical protein VN722_11920 [Hanamia sp.]|nr:hypothetical protein [Hanamia sp.]
MDVQGGIIKNLREKAEPFIELVSKAAEAALEAGFIGFLHCGTFSERLS